MAQQTGAEIAKIQAHAEQEIASAGKAARMALEALCRRTRRGAGGTEGARPHDARDAKTRWYKDSYVI